MEENDILRVISGIAGGHKLKTVKGDTTRPTADRVKESLFNIITAIVPKAVVLDLYAGTGNLGIEALSRGAELAVFVDRNDECVSVIRDNLAHTKLSHKAKIMKSDVSLAIKRLSRSKMKFDLVFMDPPYGKGLVQKTLETLSACDILNENAVVVAEQSVLDQVPDRAGCLKLVREQKYGDTRLSFYRPFGDLP